LSINFSLSLSLSLSHQKGVTPCGKEGGEGADKGCEGRRRCFERAPLGMTPKELGMTPKDGKRPSLDALEAGALLGTTCLAGR